MLIKYRFILYAESSGRTTTPLYDDSLKKDIVMQSGQRYFREELSGGLTFLGGDYDWIDAKSFGALFTISVNISYDGGVSYASYWNGYFYKTDGDWDEDNKKFAVTPKPNDDYVNVLKGLDKEYNLTKLAPSLVEVDVVKRPLIQTYVPGDTVVGCFMEGTTWELEVEPETTPATLVSYGFGLNSEIYRLEVTGTATPAEVIGDYVSKSSTVFYGKNNEYYIQRSGSGPYVYDIKRTSDDVIMHTTSEASPLTDGDTCTFSAVNGTGTPGGEMFKIDVYSRILTDSSTIDGNATAAVSASDFLDVNYDRVYEYGLDCIEPSTNISTTPTIYGLTPDGTEYFDAVDQDPGDDYFPIARNVWANFSIWFSWKSATQDTYEDDGRTSYATLRHVSLIQDVISALLDTIDPAGVSHQGNSTYSSFLYGASNPISGDTFELALTQKSNLLVGNYDQPAQKAPITLGQVLDMLRNVYQCYWYIDSSSKLRIEHISWFLNGGAYSGDPAVGRDLTTLANPRNGKTWGYNTSKYKFDKIELPERLEFSWMDQVTSSFDGVPIEISSGFTLEGKKEQIVVSHFTTDVDFMLANPSEVTKDGFALFALIDDSGYELPFVELTVKDSITGGVGSGAGGSTLELQNGYLSWIYLHDNFWKDHMPAEDIMINDSSTTATSVRKTRVQTVQFPSNLDPETMKAIKTYLGNGEIQKLSITLSTRQVEATLKYDTE